MNLPEKGRSDTLVDTLTLSMLPDKTASLKDEVTAASWAAVRLAVNKTVISSSGVGLEML